MTEHDSLYDRHNDHRNVEDAWRERRRNLMGALSWPFVDDWPPAPRPGDLPYGFFERPLWTETRTSPVHVDGSKNDMGVHSRKGDGVVEYLFDLPGMVKADVHVDLDDDGTLKVTAHHEEPSGVRELSYAVYVGAGPDRKDVSASMSDGLLTVRVPDTDDRPDSRKKDTSIEVA